ncbi:MAG: tetratricopeptide repeat protein, partial [Candidatus Auribacterota bacterium]|nr:tetratricopeptide repeat protein [Candidatus Auribacterota bacterium]
PGSPERRRRFRLLFGIAGILICLSFAGLIREYLPCWRSNLTLWTRVTILSPRSALAYNNLASVYHRQNNDCRAMVELKEALRCNPEHKEAHSNLGVLHSLAGRQDKAIFEFEESLRSDPTYYPASLHLAKIYLRQRRLDEAEDVLRGVITINAYLPKAYNALAIVLEEAGRSREAEKYYREADALNPEYVVPLRNLTALYHERKDFDRAIETGREAIKRRPGHPKGYIILARVFITMGRFEEARSLLQKSLKTNPENWRTRSLLMALESEGGRTSNQ